MTLLNILVALVESERLVVLAELEGPQRVRVVVLLADDPALDVRRLFGQLGRELTQGVTAPRLCSSARAGSGNPRSCASSSSENTSLVATGAPSPEDQTTAEST